MELNNLTTTALKAAMQIVLGRNESERYIDDLIDVIEFVAEKGEEVEKHYNQLSEKEQNYFWCQELVGGTMDVSGITLKGLKENGVFLEIERCTRLTTTRNLAMTIYNLAEKFNCTPIELINKVINH